ncbi:MAG: hypothetical protein GSR84_03720 [Desulfurococcales archaeon]|nr:hypothetical protein [Desulfurococcales archaeon]
MCYSPSNRDMELYEEARRLYKAKDLEGLKRLYERAMDEDINTEILYIVRRMVDDLEKEAAKATQ